MPLVVKVLVALVVALPPLQRYVPPPDAVKVTLPQAVAVPEMAAVGRAATLNVAVLLAEMVLVHPLEPPDCNSDTVTVVDPVLFNAVLVNVPLPAVLTVMVAV